MRGPVLITTDFPTVEDVARELGVSPKRTRELVRLAEEIVARRSNGRGKRKASFGTAKKDTSAARKGSAKPA